MTSAERHKLSPRIRILVTLRINDREGGAFVPSIVDADLPEHEGPEIKTTSFGGHERLFHAISATTADVGDRKSALEGYSLHTKVAKRWVVEPSFAWLEKCRRLWKNCERQLNTSLQFVH